MNQEQLNNFANNFVVKPKEEQYEEMELEDLEVDRTEPAMPR